MGDHFRCGGLTVAPAEGRLFGVRAEVHVRPKTMDLLVALAEREGAVAPKSELLDEIWSGASVSEAVLTNAVTELRRALAEAGGAAAMVETVPRRGYRLAAAVVRESPKPDPARSLAVLPIEDLSTPPAGERFLAAIQESLVGELAKLPAYRVLPRSAVARLPHGVSLQELCRRWRVGKLVTGSAIRNGSRVRLNAQLLDLGADRVRWSTSLVMALGDPVETPATLARLLARELATALDLPSPPTRADAPPLDRRTEELFLRAQLRLRGSTLATLEQGVADLTEVVGRLPNLAAAHAGRARGLLLLASWAADPGAKRRAAAEASAARALALEPDSTEGEVWWVLSRAFARWRLDEALWPLARLVREHPHNPEARDALAHCLAVLGRVSEAVAEGRRALADDPLSPALRGALGFFLRCAGELDEAAIVLGEALELHPEWTIARLELGRVRWAAGDCEGAAAEIGRVDAEWGGFVHALAAGDHASTRELLARWRANAKVAPYWLAERAAWAGDLPAAMAELERAAAEHQLRVVYAGVDPSFAALRSSGAFRRLLDEVAAGESTV